ncbi:MAG: hypothetical protein FWH43_08190 [Endomicrobia bacterium]|nr:hypothetical protein [Endomicrobiia bacterium]
MQEEQKQQVPQQQDLRQPVNEDEISETSAENIDKVYDVEGLLAGGAAGLGVGLLLPYDTILITQIGMFLGLLIGTRMKKDKK